MLRLGAGDLDGSRLILAAGSPVIELGAEAFVGMSWAL